MNIKRAFIALGALLLGAGFFGASPAFAVTETVQKFNNTYCWLRTGGTYPEDGHFQYCTFTAPPAAPDPGHGSNAVTRMKGLNQAKNNFYSSQGIRIIVHDSPLTYADANNLNAHVNSGEIATLFRSTRHTCQEMFSGVVGAKRRWLEF